MIDVAAIGVAPAAHETIAGCVTESNGQLLCSGITTSGASGLGIGVLAVFGIVYLAIVVVSIVAGVKIVTKAGYSGWWVLLAFVPVVGFVMTLVFAFSRWPVLREVESLRAQRSVTAWSGSLPGYGGGPGPGVPGHIGGPSPQRPSSPASSGREAGPPGGPSGQAGPGATAAEASEPPLPAFGRVVPGTADVGPGPSGHDGPQQQAAHPPAGWFPTPDGRLRYWDGASWTDHFA